MVTFLGILFGLLAINAILILFSVNGRANTSGTSEKKSVKTPVTELFPKGSADTKYKKAV